MNVRLIATARLIYPVLVIIETGSGMEILVWLVRRTFAIAPLCSFFVFSAQAAEVLVGAGDIARCYSQSDEATAALLDGIPGTVFTVGDNVYESGLDWEFTDCYQPSWGRHKARTKPAVGNHEYLTAGAAAYWGYFGAAAGEAGKGYYAYVLGGWRIYALNSMCNLSTVGGCGPASPMIKWLKADLAAHPTRCVLAYFHHPLFSSGKHGDQRKMLTTWRVLYAAGADVVVSGHDHDYERFALQTPDGALDPVRGIRQFIVGTGGGAFSQFGTVKPNSEVREARTNGVLKLTLSADSYEWEFVPIAGKTFTDVGTGLCH